MTDQPSPHASSSAHAITRAHRPLTAARASQIRMTAASTGLIAQDTRGGRTVMLALVVLFTVGVAGVWTFIARRELRSSTAIAMADRLGHAQQAFEQARIRNHDHLRALCRVMVEDPRLKSTLATEGMDEATVADILRDLGKLRRTGFLIVLSPEGRVFAQAGADELRGLDLSDSSVVKKAHESADAVVGSWVIGGKVMDLSVMGVRFGASLIAYLVVGEAIDQPLLEAVTAQTGIGVATAIGSELALVSATDAVPKAVFVAAAAGTGAARARRLELAGRSYLVTVADLEDTSQAKPRLVMVLSLGRIHAQFARLEWLLYALPVLVLVAVLFSMTANRRVTVLTRPRRNE